MFNEKIFVQEAPPSHPALSSLDSTLRTLMRRILVFDLYYLKEFKQDTFRSDFDELTFALSLILDVTRVLAEKDTLLTHIKSDALKMQKAFSKIKGRIGIMVPFERSIETFQRLFDSGIRRKLGVTSEDEVFVGTPDMFRGVEKDIVIVTQLRNSVVEGLGQMDESEYVRLAMTRAKHFLWVVGSSATLHGQL